MRRLAVVFVSAMLPALVSASPLVAQELTGWRQGVVAPKGDAGFWWMATEGGFARQQGLDLKMRAFDSDVGMTRALLKSEIDAFEGSPINAMIATSTGGDLKLLGCTWPKLTYSFFARPDIPSLADLKGKVIGISAPGSLSDVAARAMLGRIDIAPGDVKFVEAGGDAERVHAIAGRTIDAAVSTSDFAARKDLGLKSLAFANDILPSFVRACIVTRGDVWRKHPDDLVRLLAATMNGYAYALGHRAETVALARKIARLPAGDPTPDANFDEVLRNRSVSPTIDIDMQKLLWLRDLLAEYGQIDPEFEPGTMTDRGIREQALARVKAN